MQPLLDFPLISIITPTFNSAATLERTLRSVLEQGYPRLEYWIIDGGSQDGTLEIIRRYEPQLAGWISEPDRGIADAFNKGLSRATGELIGIINSDDWYEPGALRAVAERHRAGDGRAILHGDMMVHRGENTHRLRPRPCPRLFMYLDFPFNHATCFVPRTVYDDVGLYDPELRLAMDFDLLLRALRRGCRFEYLPRVLAHFTHGGRSGADPRQCHREVLRAQLAHGMSPLICRSTFAAKMMVNRLKRILRIGGA